MPSTQKTPPKPQFGDIQGKSYEFVASRTKRFRHDHPAGCIKIDVLHRCDTWCVCSCEVSDGDGNLLGRDVAEERRGEGFINKSSALENASTSATGRALDKAGYNASGEVASFEEVAMAIDARQTSPAKKKTTKKTY